MLELVQIIKDRVINPECATVEDAKFIASQIEGFVKNVHISYIGPMIGATVGPGAITISFYGEKVEIANEE